MIEVKKLDQVQPESVKLATIRILSGVVLAPGVDAQVNDVYEVPRHMATMLAAYGQAEILQADALEGYGVQIEAPTNRDPKPKRK